MRIVEMNEDKKKNLSTPVCVCAHDSDPRSARGSIRPECAFAFRVCEHTNAHRGRLDSDFPFTHRHHHAASTSAPSLSVSKMLPIHLRSPIP